MEHDSSCGAQAQQLQHEGSRARAQQLWCAGLVVPQDVGYQFPDQGLNSCLLHRKVDSSPLNDQGRPPHKCCCFSLPFSICL